MVNAVEASVLKTWPSVSADPARTVSVQCAE
jgi:hypothetical protein